MAVTFDQIPENILVPGSYVEFDSSRAYESPLGLNQVLLLIGQKLATGTAKANEAVRVVRAEDADAKFGVGSQLAEMLRASFTANSYTERWAVPLTDNAAGVAATGSITFGGAPTADGTLNIWIGGRRVQVGVASGAALATIATNAAAAINADVRCACAATAAEAVVTLTCKHKGLWGNDLDVRINYYSDERLPTGLTATIAAMSNGASNPVLDDAISALGDRQFHYIALPYTDAASLSALESELAERWGPLRPYDGIGFCAAPGTSAELAALGESRNSPHVCILGTGLSPSRPDCCAAILASTAAYYLNSNPARPLQTLTLRGMLPPNELDRFTYAERNSLLYDGVSTYRVDSGGDCLIERVVTTYNQNALGVDDYAYRDVETLANLSDLRCQLRAMLSNSFPRYTLASNSTDVSPGAAVARPVDIWAKIVALCKQLETAGRLQSVNDFKDEIIVELSETDNSRVNILLPAKLMAQLRVIAAKVQFRLVN
ncbi:phage tail sheath subtilisin-like domain-containing protein [Desulfarculus baarsii]